MALKPPFYVISDTHWFHDNIIKYQDRPYDHETIMVKHWQRAIKSNDTILHLGDLFFGGRDGYERFEREITPALTGRRKYIILGNHDKRTYDYEALGFQVIKPFTVNYRSYDISFDHYPRLFTPRDVKSNTRVFHIHGHIHTNGYARDEPERWGNINISVELTDYRPVRVTRLLNRAISKRNQTKKYRNSRHYRYHKRARQKRA